MWVTLVHFVDHYKHSEAWTTKQNLFHTMRDEIKQNHLGVARREQGDQVIIQTISLKTERGLRHCKLYTAARTVFTLCLAAF